MSDSYIPPADGAGWERVSPAAAGFDAAKLAEAVAFAEGHESTWLRDLRSQLETGTFEPPPDNFLFGPVATRGGPNGLILRPTGSSRSRIKPSATAIPARIDR